MENIRQREIGGYIELDKYTRSMLHEGALALNCGRNCLRYLIKARKIHKIALPCFLCDSVHKACEKENIDVQYYHIGRDFLPVNLCTEAGEWVYLVNYYGQLSPELLQGYKDKYKNIIVDNAQAYFDRPVEGIDTLYTCRKFFGVADGAFLYTDSQLNQELERDESYKRMEFILGRVERPASEFYDLYVRNNAKFVHEPVKKMSLLTSNLLHAVDYDVIKEKRTQNYSYLYQKLENINQLKLRQIDGAFAYPLMIDNGKEIRKKLIQQKIYVPTLWPEVFDLCKPGQAEYDMADNILPLPVDQRYSLDDMRYIVSQMMGFYREGGFV